MEVASDSDEIALVGQGPDHLLTIRRKTGPGSQINPINKVSASWIEMSVVANTNLNPNHWIGLFVEPCPINIIPNWLNTRVNTLTT